MSLASSRLIRLLAERIVDDLLREAAGATLAPNLPPESPPNDPRPVRPLQHRQPAPHVD